MAASIKRLSANGIEAQWKSQLNGKISINFSILSIDWDIFKYDKKSTNKGGFHVTIHLNDNLMATIPQIGKNDVDFIIDVEDAETFQYYEVRVADLQNKKPIGMFRVHISFNGTFVRPLDSIRIHYASKSSGKFISTHSFADRLCGAYQQLFSDGNDNMTTSKTSHIDLNYIEEPAQFVIEPRLAAPERIISFRNHVIQAPSDTRGALILTNLRLIFIPNFVDIKQLVEATLGDKQEKSVDEVAQSFEARGMGINPTELQEFLVTVDTNGDGKLSGEELSAFIVTHMEKFMKPERFKGFRIPIFQIGNVKLPKQGDSSRIGLDDDDDDERKLVKFDEGDIEVSVVSFERKYSRKYPLGGVKNTYYMVNVLVVGIPDDDTTESSMPPPTSLLPSSTSGAEIDEEVDECDVDSAKIDVNDKKAKRGEVVHKRYSEFITLRDALISGSSVRLEELPQLPKPKEAYSTSRDSRRLADVGKFMDAVLKFESTRNPLVAEFLGVTESLLNLQKVQTEKDEEEKRAMMSADRQLASALLADFNKTLSNKPGHPIRVVAKTGFQAIFVIPEEENSSASIWSSNLKKEIAWLRAEGDGPDAFSIPEDFKGLKVSNGVKLMGEEYARFGINTVEDFLNEDENNVQQEKWRIVNNRNFAICETYPAIFAVPGHADMNMITDSAKQRSKRRLPALCWIHPIHGTPLCRSAQPLAGLKGSMNEVRIKWDMLMAIRDMVPGSSLTVIDARPKLNARANALAGKGFEDIADMPGLATIEFMDIGNIHTMRNSLALMSAACLTEKNDFYDLLAASKWLVHVKMLIRGANILATALDNKSPVLVHCSDGWDRTSQLAALGQLLLDPFYRTFKGFATLVEKEFCSFGHMFAKRSDYKSHEYSPIFLQFVDAVWQIQQQFSNSFEFNEEYLITVVDGFYSGWSTTFLGDCERERDVLRVRFQSAASLWELMDIDKLRNNSYRQLPVEVKLNILKPKFSMQAMKFWSGLYLRNNPIC